ncbi:hypothetical protein, partial [Lysobacter capsici]|uniref:hypothetical protein n=1 Tax=Lysobacter capsici TaxID=435897 RepID=UPI00398D26ED
MLHRDKTMSTKRSRENDEFFTNGRSRPDHAGSVRNRPVQRQRPCRKAIAPFSRGAGDTFAQRESRRARMTALPIVMSAPPPKATKSNHRHGNCAKTTSRKNLARPCRSGASRDRDLTHATQADFAVAARA